jgi:DNA polymerase-1
VPIDRKHVAYDPRSIDPLLLSLALLEPVEAETAQQNSKDWRLYRFVVDLRVPEVLPSLKSLFQLPVCFVAHYAHADLPCLFQLGLPDPSLLWDTWVHEKAIHLGRNHKRYKSARMQLMAMKPRRPRRQPRRRNSATP